MKKICLILTILMLLRLNAQIQITQSHMPSIGDTIRYSISTSVNTDFTLTGTNYSWNYSNLNLSSQDIYKFQSLLSTPYSTLAFTGMPVGAIGYKVADSIGQGQIAFKNIYNFYDKKSTGWSAVGTGFTLSAIPMPAGGVYNDKDEIYLFPLKYGDHDSSTFDVTTLLGNIIVKLGTFRQKGYRINDVVGWGTITTPYGNNINCIKVRSVVFETDSLKITTPAINLGFVSNRVEYRWLSTSEKIPLLEVSGTEVNGNFTPLTIRYRDNYRSSNPSPFIPRVRFDADRYIGSEGKDTFKFLNNTTPSIGNSYKWTITPSTGVRYTAGSETSAEPRLIFDSSGYFTVKLEAQNIAGTDDSTAVNMIQIIKLNPGDINSVKRELLPFYPNPSSGVLHFSDLILAGKTCRIFDMNGKLLLQEIIGTDLLIRTANIAPGNYFLLISDTNYIYQTQITIQ